MQNGLLHGQWARPCFGMKS